ncbi:GMP synthase (glutamine-hydrolyzing), subunit A [Natronococcus amylolyticus DSM 10524]|uniref:GMP synthase (Glutamine-hydrolyzing), subunit A n=1 Tax=Natronococcus amylolyticus DSM 10524 TaxID=1227497 RepID=L9X942_9EURY|nr:type 1 glutamine amidotransferase [Natronococcus amylolyticus]ELY58112.1 GMP synthase (glutamine-hydrolyzing), subunit A [Natronococcus amylolyticus DSM 10524]
MTALRSTASTLYVVRSEVDPDCEYHCDALASRFPDATEIDFVAGERPPLEDADGVVLTGSTAAVYEADRRPWIADQEALVRELVDRKIPTLGVCFGHQVANAALGGTVENVGTTATLVEADLADDPLFEGVAPVVPAVHGDAVTEPGEEMDVIVAADHAPVFGTRHRSAPLWTVQFHPEITAAVRDRLVEDFGWESKPFSFDDVSADRVFENFRTLVDERRE